MNPNRPASLHPDQKLNINLLDEENLFKDKHKRLTGLPVGAPRPKIKKKRQWNATSDSTILKEESSSIFPQLELNLPSSGTLTLEEVNQSYPTDDTETRNETFLKQKASHSKYDLNASYENEISANLFPIKAARDEVDIDEFVSPTNQFICDQNSSLPLQGEGHLIQNYESVLPFTLGKSISKLNDHLDGNKTEAISNIVSPRIKRKAAFQISSTNFEKEEITQAGDLKNSFDIISSNNECSLSEPKPKKSKLSDQSQLIDSADITTSHVDSNIEDVCKASTNYESKFEMSLDSVQSSLYDGALDRIEELLQIPQTETPSEFDSKLSSLNAMSQPDNMIKVSSECKDNAISVTTPKNTNEENRSLPLTVENPLSPSQLNTDPESTTDLLSSQQESCQTENIVETKYDIQLHSKVTVESREIDIKKEKQENEEDNIKKEKEEDDNKKEKEKNQEDDIKKGKLKDDYHLSSEDETCNSDNEGKKNLLQKRIGATGLSARPKVKNLRRNIRDIICDDKLEENTLAAQKEEQLRLKRLQEKQFAMREYIEQQQVERLVAEVAEAAASDIGIPTEKVFKATVKIEPVVADADIVVLSSEDDSSKIKSEESELESDSESRPSLDPKIDIKNEVSSSDEDDISTKEESEDSDSDIMILSHSEDEDDVDDDVSNSGAHVNDDFNTPDVNGQVLVNVGHPDNEEDIFLAPQLAAAVKPHQIGGIRFLYDNIVESLEQFKTSNGFGCILAHSMGLGKTLQLISLTDVFLRHTGSRRVLIIVPINTLQNWLSEYNQWLPDNVPAGQPENTEIRPRVFKVFLLNDGQKTTKSRAKVVKDWHDQGGVLLMGYELYRQLSLRKPKKAKRKKKRESGLDIEVDVDKELLDDMHEALVRPGPDLVICDEGHRIKNAHANISQALKSIRTKRRVVLTGYPLQNSLLEYWCMVDFVRPNYLGTKTEFCNMFERPIQNGQCVDSTPQDVKLMRYRAHVLHSLLEGFVQRRGHSVLALTLPMKHEHVLLCRMTTIQRKLYTAYMAELTVNKGMANPLKAFAICCKIWNHPDILFNLVMKRTSADFDLDLAEVVGKAGRPKKALGGKREKNKNSNQQIPPPVWGTNMVMPSKTDVPKSSAHVPPSPAHVPMDIQGNMEQHTPNMMHSNIIQGQMPQIQNGAQSNINMGYGYPGMYNMQQGYNMNQLPYPWQYNHGFSPNSTDTNNSSYMSPYGGHYSSQYPLQPHMQPTTPSQTSQQNLNNFSSMASHNSTSIGSSPAHHLHMPSTQTSEQNTQTAQHQENVNLTHQSNQMQQHSIPQTVLDQNSPGFINPNTPIISDQVTAGPSSKILSTENQSCLQSSHQIKHLIDHNQPMQQLCDTSGTVTNIRNAEFDVGMPQFPSQTSESTLISEQMKGLVLESSTKHNLILPTNAGTYSPSNSIPLNSVPFPDEQSLNMEAKDTNILPSPEDKKELIDGNDKKDDFKRDEMYLEWAENLLKEYIPGLVENSSKFQIFFKILEEALSVGDRMLVFSQSLFTLSLLEEFLQKSFIPGTAEGWSKNRSYYRLDGSTTSQERDKLINDFNINPKVHIFLVSTRAGSLGINLVGANRVIVFDASFNPCHDTQAVCRVYRYGQRKSCHIYRFVTDNSLERRIYDRQINKQGIADRIVDEMNPEAHLSSKEISNLLVENEEDPVPEDFTGKADELDDPIFKDIIVNRSSLLTRLPFRHESLLVDRKDKKLSNAEKRLAKRSYELEKQANISYTRPSYSAFYPKTSGNQSILPGSKSGGILYAKSVGTMRPMQAELGHKMGGGHMIRRPNILSRSEATTPVESLAKQGVSVQQITVPKDVSIPTNSGDGKPIQLKAGQSVMVIKTQKGMYLRLTDGKIVAIRIPPGNEDNFGLPLNQGSVTIVPTVVNHARSRTVSITRGGGLTRRGRPPLSAQYALGQVVPKGAAKGQVAVRLLQKTVISGRGAKSYQTIAVPASNTGTLLNKSVVIRAATSSGHCLSNEASISANVQITPVVKSRRLTSIAGASGLTRRLHRNNKILSAQQAALKSDEDKKLTKLQVGIGSNVKDDRGNPGPCEVERAENTPSESDTKTDVEKRSNEILKAALPVDRISNILEAASQNMHLAEKTDTISSSLRQNDLMLPVNSPSPVLESSKNIHLGEENKMIANPPELPYFNKHTDFLPSNENQHKSTAPVEDHDNFNFISSNRNPEDMRDMALAGNEQMSNASCSINQNPQKVFNENAITPLSQLSNLVPPDNRNNLNPGNIYSHAASINSPISSQSVFSSQSQPLFQPFLQQSVARGSHSSLVNSAVVTNIPTNQEVMSKNWPRETKNPEHIFGNTVGVEENQDVGTSHDTCHNSPGISHLGASHENAVHTTESQNMNPTTVSFSSLPVISQKQQPTLDSLSEPSTNTIERKSIVNPVVSATEQSVNPQSNSNPLNISSLIPSQTFSQPTPEDLGPATTTQSHEFINYSSAFRRIEFPTALPNEVQNILNVSTTSDVSSSTAQSQYATSGQASAAAVFSSQGSPFSLYPSSYNSSSTPGFRAPSNMNPTGYPYVGQFAPYGGQYPNVNQTPVPLTTPSIGQYPGIQTPANHYQGYSSSGNGVPPYSPGVEDFGQGPYPPM